MNRDCRRYNLMGDDHCCNSKMNEITERNFSRFPDADSKLFVHGNSQIRNLTSFRSRNKISTITHLLVRPRVTNLTSNSLLLFIYPVARPESHSYFEPPILHVSQQLNSSFRPQRLRVNFQVREMVAMAGVALPSSNYPVFYNQEPNSSFLRGLPLKGLCLQLKPRRIKSVSSAITTASAVTSSDSGARSGRFYLNFTGFPFPLGPFLNRRTIRTEVSYFMCCFCKLVSYFISNLYCSICK